VKQNLFSEQHIAEIFIANKQPPINLIKSTTHYIKGTRKNVFELNDTRSWTKITLTRRTLNQREKAARYP